MSEVYEFRRYENTGKWNPISEDVLKRQPVRTVPLPTPLLSDGANAWFRLASVANSRLAWRQGVRRVFLRVSGNTAEMFDGF